jgi:hypothetical protein
VASQPAQRPTQVAAKPKELSSASGAAKRAPTGSTQVAIKSTPARTPPRRVAATSTFDARFAPATGLPQPTLASAPVRAAYAAAESPRADSTPPGGMGVY